MARPPASTTGTGSSHLHRFRLALRHLRLPAAAVVVAGALVLPSSTFAASLTVDHTTATAIYRAGAGETNKLSFYRLASVYRVMDQGVNTIAVTEIGTGQCEQTEEWKYRCPISSINAAVISLGDGSDTFDGSNTPIAYTITAGPDAKTITTGPGPDAIYARNGA